MPDNDASIVLTGDMRAVVQSAHLCFAATVTSEGHPNLSPKGTIRVWDDRHLFFLDIASPGTRANLAAHPWMELNIVDQLSRRGYRFFGRTTLHTGGAVFDRAVQIVAGEERTTYSVAAVVMLEVQRAALLISPGYWRVADESAMREHWRKRRASLDREFEEHLKLQGAFRVEH